MQTNLKQWIKQKNFDKTTDVMVVGKWNWWDKLLHGPVKVVVLKNFKGRAIIKSSGQFKDLSSTNLS